MRRVILLAIMAAAPALADQNDDRLAVMRAILALNYVPPPQSIFTPDASVDPRLDQLWKGRPIRTRVIAPRPGERPTVQISHEPWGEATIGLPHVRFEITNPRIVTDAVDFITADLAVVDAASVYHSNSGREEVRLLLIVSRRGGEW